MSDRRPALVTAALLLVLLGLAGCSDDPPASPDQPDPTTITPTPTDPVEPTRASPEQFCEAFRAFAEASNAYVAVASQATGTALVEAGQTLASLDPLGLSAGGQVTLDQLVNGSLEPLGVTVEPFSDALPDATAFDAYLTDNCPA